MFETKNSKIKDCIQLIPKIFEDNRGSFVKVFHKDIFLDLGIDENFSEEYYSRSLTNVVRGLHFQIPPMDHSKLVYCIDGSVFDVVVDLRIGSPTFGMFDTFNLNAKSSNILYIPKGMAHGFCSTSESATMIYKTSTVYNKDFDAGILWNSIKIPWPIENPIISERDKKLPSFASFKSPFVY